jgi:hypothetical protein
MLKRVHQLEIVKMLKTSFETVSENWTHVTLSENPQSFSKHSSSTSLAAKDEYSGPSQGDMRKI